MWGRGEEEAINIIKRKLNNSSKMVKYKGKREEACVAVSNGATRVGLKKILKT